MVYKGVFTVFTQFCLLLLQLQFGNLGWYLPLAQLGALYTVLALGRNWGIAAAVINSLVLSALYGGSWNLLYIIFNPLLAGALGWWIDRHDEDIRADFFVPGIWAGAMAALPKLLQEIFNWMINGIFPADLHITLLKMMWCALVSGGVFLLFIFWGEALTEFFGMPRFASRKGGHKR